MYMHARMNSQTKQIDKYKLTLSQLIYTKAYVKAKEASLEKENILQRLSLSGYDPPTQQEKLK